MTSVLFEVRELPDLTLNKYAVLGGNGIEEVLSSHGIFLRQLYRLGQLLNGTFRWYYQHNPNLPKGNRMRIGLRWDFEREVDPLEISRIALASSLAKYFRLQPIPLGSSAVGTSFDLSASYRWRASLKKKEKVAESDSPDKRSYYSVNRWEINPGGRLFGLFSLMREMNTPCMYSVFIKPKDLADDIEKPELLGNTLSFLRRVLALRVDKSAIGAIMQKDEAADYTLKRYKELIEEVSANPHFLANITAYANDPVTAGALLDAAAAESITEGMHDVGFHQGTYNTNELFISDLTLDAVAAAPKELRFWPNLFLLDELAPFVRLPALYDGETVEVRKETAPRTETTGFALGVDLDGLEVDFPLKSFPKHAFICGVPGSGKTNTMMHIASTLHQSFGVPLLILEPAKREYRALFNQDGMEDLILFSPSAGTHFPLHINPFEFPQGVSLAEHIRLLDDVFAGAFNLENPAPFILDSCIEDVYRAKGWHPKMLNEAKLPFPTLRELYEQIERRVDETDYDPEQKGNLKSFLQVRFGSLLTREMGDVFDVPSSSITPDNWLTTSVIVETEAMGEGPANFLSLLLSTLIREALKAHPLPANADKSKPRHVIFYEEAHNLIGPTTQPSGDRGGDPKIAATAFIVKMLAEVRALNEAIIIADQLPSALAPEVVKNTSLKISHRLVDQEERTVACGAMSASGVQFERMATFTTGQALVSYEGLLRPFETRMAQWAAGTVSTDSPSDAVILKRIVTLNGPLHQAIVKSADITLEKYGQSCDAALTRLDHAARIAQTLHDELARIASKQEECIRTIRTLTAQKRDLSEARGQHGVGISASTAQKLDGALAELDSKVKQLERQRAAHIDLERETSRQLSTLTSRFDGIIMDVEGIWADLGFYAQQNPVRKRDVTQFLAERKTEVDERLRACAAAGLGRPLLATYATEE